MNLQHKNIRTELNGPHNDRFTNAKGKYECFNSYGDSGIDVGNTAVNCKTIWVLETAGVREFDDKGLAMYYRQGYLLRSHASTLYFKFAFALYLYRLDLFSPFHCI